MIGIPHGDIKKPDIEPTLLHLHPDLQILLSRIKSRESSSTSDRKPMHVRPVNSFRNRCRCARELVDAADAADSTGFREESS